MIINRLAKVEDGIADKNFQTIRKEFDEIEGEDISHTFGGSANTEEAISHGLGRVPTQFDIRYKDRACDVYDGDTAWTNKLIYLKCTVASAVTTLTVR